MQKKELEIHSENILPIIKKWLYSEKDIFVRELVSNAIDAIQKVKILRERNQVPANEQELRIDIKINKEAKTLQFIDTGVGMDADEVQKYIAQIAFSGAEEFIEKYKQEDEKDQFIGHFGLGFYSAYMVADKVQIETLSSKADAEPVFWSCDGSTQYEIDKGTRIEVGTTITLFINADSEEFLEEARMKQILTQYCSFLPFPIYLDGKLINSQEPLWIKAPSECTDEDYLKFYRFLYPYDEDPLFWVHLNVDYPFHLKGILYFPKIQKEMDLNKSSVKLYCNRVFVSDNCKDVIPNYLMVLRGVIDSPDIPLNVSRSYLQVDKTVRLLSNHISKKVSDSLAQLYRSDREKFLKIWHDVSIVVKLGILEDEKFYERAKEFLVWKNSDGAWTTVEEYLERNREKTHDKIYYTKDEKHASNFLGIFKSKNIEVLCVEPPLDPYLIEYIERKISPVRFQRIDGGIDDHLLDKEREKSVLDASGRTEAAKLADFIRHQLSEEKIEVEAKSLAADALPAFIMIDEQQRRMRDYMQRLDPAGSRADMGIGKGTLVVNTNSKLIHAIHQLETSNPVLAKELVRQTYDLALLSQREMDPAALNGFINRTNHVLESLLEQKK
ncbi:MAG: molecular chaperone HtpG [Parachlamydiaceae bacterium]|nr:molecular chaperone HtpG [Parachlamydiaceae bacterium]